MHSLQACFGYVENNCMHGCIIILQKNASIILDGKMWMFLNKDIAVYEF